MPELASQDRQDLIEQLHGANEHFHASREEWEHRLNASDYRHQERVDAARDQLRDAEREVEAVEQHIRQALAGESTSGEHSRSSSFNANA